MRRWYRQHDGTIWCRTCAGRVQGEPRACACRDEVRVQRQPQSRRWGIYVNGGVVEGGFFDRQAALEAARDYEQPRVEGEDEECPF